MKKTICVLAGLAMTLNIIPAQAVRGYRSAWVEVEDSSTVISGDWANANDGNASGKKAMKLDTKKAEAHEISISFTLSYDGEYDIYILGTPGSTDWASTRRWKLNEGEYQADKAIGLGTIYKTADARGAGMSWQKLTTTSLQRGSNTINFYADKFRSSGNDFCYSVLDVLAVVPVEWGWSPDGLQTRPYDKTAVKMNVVSGKASKNNLKQEETFDVEIEYRLSEKTDGMPKLYAELAKNGETVSRVLHTPTIPFKSWGEGIIHKEVFTIKVPFNISDGYCEIRAGVEGIDLASGEENVVVDMVKIGTEEESKVTPLNVSFSNVNIPPTLQKGVAAKISADFELNREIGKEARPYLAIWKDGLLYDVLEGETPIDESAGSFSFTATPVSDLIPGMYDAAVGIHYAHSNSEDNATVEVSGANPEKAKYHKPMSFGHYYSKVTGREQFWYINQCYTPIWNGEPYIPFGGMFVSSYLYNYKDGDDAGNRQRFLSDVEDLEKIKASGVNDLYVNPVSNGNKWPSWVWKYLLDYLDSAGWYYGIQASVKSGDNTGEVYYPRAADESKRFAVHNIEKSGKVTLTSGSNFAVGITELISAVYVVINDETNEVVDSGNCELKFDEEGKVEFEADVKLENEQSHSAYFTPKVFGSISPAKSFWKNTQIVCDNIEAFTKNLECGDNLRLCVDVQGNEMGFFNKNEGARIADSEFDESFKEWLEAKYKTLSELNVNWKTEPKLKSFDEAVALIPVYTSSKDENNRSYSIFVNNKTGDAYTVDTHTGVAWNDYLDARDDEYLKYNNISADKFKEALDVPVVYKHCSVNRRYLINKNAIGGFDGLGCETYGATAKTARATAMTGSLVDQMTRTGWHLVTETNTEEDMEKKFKSNEWSYPSEENMMERFTGMLDAGSKGIYDFLLKDEYDLGGNLGKAYSWVLNPNTIEWAEKFNNMIEKDIDKYANKRTTQDKFFVYPAYKNWWFNPTERGVVQLLDDTLSTSLLRTKEGVGNHISPTDSLAVDSKLIFVNIQDGPYSNIFGPEVSKLLNEQPKDKRICILGHRNDIGTIPEVDKYYSNEKVVIDEDENETVQILIPTPTSEILKTTEDGKPWALRDGELYIVASDKVFYFNETEGHIKYVDELGVTDTTSLVTGVIEPKDGGFADMKGHWAEDDVNYMKEQGIAKGVGDNKFMPDSDISVAEYIAFITRIMGYKQVGIEPYSWYSEAMSQAEDNGLLTAAMKSNPERAIKREEMAYIAAKALGRSDAGFDLDIFTDNSDISDDMRWAVAVAAELGVVDGMDDGTFRPGDNSTRAQAAVIAKRIMLKK